MKLQRFVKYKQLNEANPTTSQATKSLNNGFQAFMLGALDVAIAVAVKHASKATKDKGLVEKTINDHTKKVIDYIKRQHSNNPNDLIDYAEDMFSEIWGSCLDAVEQICDMELDNSDKVNRICGDCESELHKLFGI